MRTRSWRWLRLRITGLANRPMPITEYGDFVYQNRVQAVVYAPTAAPQQQAANE